MQSPQPEMDMKRTSFNKLYKFIVDHWLDYSILVLISGVIIGLDQWTKALVRANVPLGADWLPSGLAWLMPYVRVRHWYNSGAAFGIFQNGNLVFSVLAVIVMLLILYYFPRTQRNDWWLRAAMSLQFAGAAGNLIDRILFAHVTDFISVGSFAIFNVADASISTGVVVLLVGVWLKERSEKRLAASAVPPLDNMHDPEGNDTRRNHPDDGTLKGEDGGAGGRSG